MHTNCVAGRAPPLGANVDPSVVSSVRPGSGFTMEFESLLNEARSRLILNSLKSNSLNHPGFKKLAFGAAGITIGLTIMWSSSQVLSRLRTDTDHVPLNAETSAITPTLPARSHTSSWSRTRR